MPKPPGFRRREGTLRGDQHRRGLGRRVVPVGCAVEEGRRPAHRVAALLKGRREVNLPAASASALAANPLAPPRDCFQQTRQLKLVEETAKE